MLNNSPIRDFQNSARQQMDPQQGMANQNNVPEQNQNVVQPQIQSQNPYEAFDQLEQTEEFQNSNWNEKIKFAEEYGQQFAHQKGLKGEEAYNAQKEIEGEFRRRYQPGALQGFTDSLHDAFWSIPRIGMKASKLAWQGIAAGAEALQPDESDKLQGLIDHARGNQELLEGWVQKRSKSELADLYDWTTTGMVTGGLSGMLMRGLQTKAAPQLAGMLESKATTFTKSAFSAGLGEVAIHSALEKVVEPMVMKSEMDDSVKNTILMTAPIILGLASAMGPEQVVDRMIKNQAFTSEIGKLANKGILPNQIATNSKLMRQIGRLLDNEFKGASDALAQRAELNRRYLESVLQESGNVRFGRDEQMTQMKNYYEAESKMAIMSKDRDGLIREMNRLNDDMGRLDVFGEPSNPVRDGANLPTKFDNFKPFKTIEIARYQAKTLGLDESNIHPLPTEGFVIARRGLASEELGMLDKLAQVNKRWVETVNESRLARQKAKDAKRTIGEGFYKQNDKGQAHIYKTKSGAERALNAKRIYSNKKDITDQRDFLTVVKDPDGRGWQIRAKPPVFRLRDYPEIVRFAFSKNEDAIPFDETNATLGVVQRNYWAAQNQIKPGANVDPDKMMKMFREFEDLIGEFKSRQRSTENLSPSQLRNRLRHDANKLVESNIMTKQQSDVVMEVVTKLHRQADFRMMPESDRVSSYDEITNIIRLSDPKHFTHELGHYVWYNIATRKQRLDFLDSLMRNYNSEEAWARLMPSRSKVMKYLTDRGGSTTAVNRPAELYAEVVSHYLQSYKLSMPEAKSLVSGASRALKSIYASQRVQKNLTPAMKKHMHEVFRAPDVEDLMGRRAHEVTDLLDRHPLHMSSDEFARRVEADMDQFDPASYDQWMTNIVRNGHDAFDAMQGTGASLENILENVYMDVLRWGHTGGVDPKSLDAVFDRLIRLFDPNNKDETMRWIAATKDRVVRSKYGDKDPDNVPQADAAQRWQDDPGAEISRIRSGVSKRELYESGIDQQYKALKEYFNQIGTLREAYNVTFEQGRVIPSFMRQVDSLLVSRRAEAQAARQAEARARDAADERAATRKGPGEDEDEWIARTYEDGDFLDEHFLGMSRMDSTGMQLKVLPQTVSFALGLRFDDESGVEIPGIGKVTWDPVRWAKYGAPLSAYSMFKRPGSRLIRNRMSKFWSKLETEKPLVTEWLELKYQATVMNPFLRSFYQREGTTGELAKIHEMNPKLEQRVKTRLNKLASEIEQKFSPEERKMISELITRDGSVDSSIAGKKVREQADEVKHTLNMLKEDLIASGMPRKVFDKFGDDWLPRIYSRRGAFKNWGQHGMNKAIRKEFQSIGAKYLMPRGLAHTVRRGEKAFQQLTELDPNIAQGSRVLDFGEGDARIFVPESRKDITSKYKEMGIEPNHKWEVEQVSTEKGKIGLRRDYSRMERQTMGEVLDVAPRIMEAGRQMAKDIAFGNTLQRVAQQPNLVFDPRKFAEGLPKGSDIKQALANEQSRLINDGWIELPNTEAAKGTGIKRYGQLAGKLVAPDVHYVLKRQTSMHRPDNPFWRKVFNVYSPLIKGWKVAKTAYNPGTHGRNFTANLWMCAFQGRAPWEVVRLGATHILKKDEIFQQAIEAGMLDSNVLRADLDMGRFIDMAKNPKYDTNMMSKSSDEFALSYFQQVNKSIRSAGRKVGRKAMHVATRPMRWYELGDEVFKMGVFAQEMRRGRNAEQAINEANRIFFDYRDVPSGVQFVRDWGMVPFITYVYKVIPVLAKTMKDHPERIIAAIGMHEAINEIMYQHDAASVEEAEALKERDYDKQFMPDYSRQKLYGVGPYATMNIGSRENDVGIEYTNRYDYILNMPGGDALSLRGLFQGFPTGMNPVATILSGMLTNRDPSFDKAIAPHDEPLSGTQKMENFKARRDFILRTVLPNVPLYPGSWSKDKIGNALTSAGVLSEEVSNQFGWTGKDYWGTDVSFGQELVNFLGIGRFRRYYPEMEGIRKVQVLDAAISGEQRKIKRMAMDQRTSEAEIQRAIEGLIDNAKANNMEISRIANLIQDVYKARARAQTGD